MTTPPYDLISMADIARLAGESRSTVGNWKARNPDEFPPERGRSPRGPLYDRTEVIEWLAATERLNERPPEVVVMWQLADDLRDGMTADDAMQFALLLLAVMATAPKEWDSIRQARADRMDAHLRSTVVSLFPYAEQLLPRGSLPHTSVQRAIDTLSTVDPSTVPAMTDALLEQAAQTLAHRGGEFLTPTSVRQLVVALTDPKGTVYNPATGAGQLIADIAKVSPASTVFVGQEINSQIWAMAQLNLAIHGVKTDVFLGDVFTADAFPALRADRVVSVPPWGKKFVDAERLRDDPRWVFGEPGPIDNNTAWIQHCLYHLADGGRAILVLPSAVQFESGRSGRIRQRLIKAGLLDAVIALPLGLFPGSGVAASMLIFAKGRPTVHGKPASTLMIDLSDLSQDQGTRFPRLYASTIDQVAGQYRDWAEHGKHPTTENAAVASYDELVVNDFVIAPSRYLALSVPSVSVDEAVNRRSELTADLARLLQASKQADDELENLLEVRQ